MRTVIAAVALLSLFPVVASAEEQYIYTNHRLDYVKIERIPKKRLAEKSPTHPATVSVDKMREMLGSITLGRRLFFKKQIKEREVFTERAVNFLAPWLVQAFEKAGADEQVIFSYLMKEPEFVVRNDRFTAAVAWIKGNELHIEFLKLHAKLEGDYDKRGNFDKVVNRAKGLRVELEPQPGQILGADDASELIFDMSKTFAGAARTPEDDGGDASGKKATRTTGPSTAERLSELEKLHRAKLITDKEYENKRRQILSQF